MTKIKGRNTRRVKPRLTQAEKNIIGRLNLDFRPKNFLGRGEEGEIYKAIASSRYGKRTVAVKRMVSSLHFPSKTKKQEFATVIKRVEKLKKLGLPVPELYKVAKKKDPETGEIDYFLIMEKITSDKDMSVVSAHMTNLNQFSNAKQLFLDMVKDLAILNKNGYFSFIHKISSVWILSKHFTNNGNIYAKRHLTEVGHLSHISEIARKRTSKELKELGLEECFYSFMSLLKTTKIDIKIGEALDVYLDSFNASGSFKKDFIERLKEDYK